MASTETDETRAEENRADDGRDAVTATGEQPATSPRMEEFQRQIAGLRLRGQGTGPEGRLLIAGLALLAAGLVMVAIGWFQAAGTTVQHKQIDYLISGGVGGIGVTLVGAAFYVRASMGRYLRYWLIRLVYEQREQTDRAVEALNRIEERLSQRPQ